MAKSISDMQHEVTEWAKGQGFYDTPRSFGDSIALLHSEVSEALEAYRDWGLADATEPQSKPEGVGAEFADVFMRLLDDCSRYGVDLEAEYERKLAYNRTRPYRHGKANL